MEVGYAWAYPKAAELNEMCHSVLVGMNKNRRGKIFF
jgi:hypothetical protein